MEHWAVLNLDTTRLRSLPFHLRRLFKMFPSEG